MNINVLNTVVFRPTSIKRTNRSKARGISRDVFHNRLKCHVDWVACSFPTRSYTGKASGQL